MGLERVVTPIYDANDCVVGWAMRTIDAAASAEPTVIEGITGTVNSDPFVVAANDYSRIGVQIEGLTGGSGEFQVSNDGTNWYPQDLAKSSEMETPVFSFGADGFWEGAVCARYFRLAFNSAAGTIVVTIVGA